jgi:hypothetical protein
MTLRPPVPGPVLGGGRARALAALVLDDSGQYLTNQRILVIKPS